MSISIESSKFVVVHPDCADTQEKRNQVFLANLYEAGPTMPGDLDPRSGQEVRVEIAGDVLLQSMAAVCVKAAQVEIR